MPSLLESVTNFQEVKYKKIQRSAETYQAVQEWAIDEITRNVANYTTVMGIPAKVINKNNKKNNKNFTPYGTPVDLDYKN